MDLLRLVGHPPHGRRAPHLVLPERLGERSVRVPLDHDDRDQERIALDRQITQPLLGPRELGLDSVAQLHHRLRPQPRLALVERQQPNKVVIIGRAAHHLTRTRGPRASLGACPRNRKGLDGVTGA